MSNDTRDAFGSPMCKLKYNRMGYKRYLAPARTHTYIHIQHQNVASLLTFDFSYGGAESIDTVICQALNRQRRRAWGEEMEQQPLLNEMASEFFRHTKRCTLPCCGLFMVFVFVTQSKSTHTIRLAWQITKAHHRKYMACQCHLHKKWESALLIATLSSLFFISFLLVIYFFASFNVWARIVWRIRLHSYVVLRNKISREKERGKNRRHETKPTDVKEN